MTALALVNLEPALDPHRCPCRVCRRAEAQTPLLPFDPPIMGPAVPRIGPPVLAIVVPEPPASRVRPQVRDLTFGKVFKALRRAGICDGNAVAEPYGLEDLTDEEFERTERACFLAGHVPGRVFTPAPVKAKRPTGTGCDDLLDREVSGLKVLRYLGKNERNRTLFEVECVFCAGVSEREGRNIIKSRPDGCGKCPGSKRRTGK